MKRVEFLGAAAALALVLPLAAPTTSFAQGRGIGGPMGGGHVSVGGGGGAPHFSGGGAPHFVGGGAPHFAGAAPMMRRSGPVGGAAPAFNAGAARTFAATSPQHWQGGGGNWQGGWRHRHHGGFWPGFAAGAAIGGLGSYAYYGGGSYYGDPYYYNDDYYYDDQGPAVAVVPETGGDAVAYCQQRYRSYDPASGTFLGYDGLRHPCP